MFLGGLAILSWDQRTQKFAPFKLKKLQKKNLNLKKAKHCNSKWHPKVITISPIIIISSVATTCQGIKIRCERLACLP